MFVIVRKLCHRRDCTCDSAGAIFVCVERLSASATVKQGAKRFESSRSPSPLASELG